ncbi:hypothetical protein SAY86_021780 [Trapa natans]|uniref:Uncharacterized protein n=1 Tax=Trapa natans TaxID=22666 RepID=A0AAN7MZP0_TRANT|nr:hypothetical protein SAY86_021780 [Trapa natans]
MTPTHNEANVSFCENVSDEERNLSSVAPAAGVMNPTLLSTEAATTIPPYYLLSWRLTVGANNARGWHTVPAPRS